MATPYEYGPVKQVGEGVAIQIYLNKVPINIYIISVYFSNDYRFGWHFDSKY